ncbi:AgmX/PglI C-terminal domain-containing protein [Myxococcaceae bacterium GXIMD 01537]
MKWTLVTALVLGPALALAQGAAAPKSPAAPKSAPARPAPAEPDVNRMPFTPDSIRQVVQFHAPKIQACYEDHMAARDKKVEGKILTSFTITPDGLVKNAKVLKKGSSVHDAGLNDCVVAVLTAANFPKPSDGRDHPIEYPFNLKAIE